MNPTAKPHTVKGNGIRFMKSLFAAALFFTCFCCRAQVPAWSITDTVNGAESCRQVFADNYGNVYAFENTDLGRRLFFISKEGNIVWRHAISNSYYADRTQIVSAPGGFVYVRQNLDRYGLLEKYDSAGVRVWAYINDTINENFFDNMAVDGLGDVFLSVGFSLGMPAAKTVKVAAANGQELWSRSDFGFQLHYVIYGDSMLVAIGGADSNTPADSMRLTKIETATGVPVLQKIIRFKPGSTYKFHYLQVLPNGNLKAVIATDSADGCNPFIACPDLYRTWLAEFDSSFTIVSEKMIFSSYHESPIRVRELKRDKTGKFNLWCARSSGGKSWIYRVNESNGFITDSVPLSLLPRYNLNLYKEYLVLTGIDDQMCGMLTFMNILDNSLHSWAAHVDTQSMFYTMACTDSFFVVGGTLVWPGTVYQSLVMMVVDSMLFSGVPAEPVALNKCAVYTDSRMLRLTCTESIETDGWAIYDINGRLMRTGKAMPANAVFSINDLSSGAYFLSLSTGGRVSSYKFVK